MLSRSAEAARLESDYLQRLSAALAGRPADERQQILQDVKAHIEEALADAGAEPVTLVGMAAVLERLGSPESFVSEAAQGAGVGGTQTLPYATTIPQEPRLGVESLPLAKQVVDRVWWGELIGLASLSVPVIELEVCAIISSLVLGQICRRTGARIHAGLKTIGTMEFVVAGLYVLMAAVSIAALLERGIVALNLPLALAAAVLAIVTFWWRQSIFARWMDDIGRAEIARTIRFRRTISVCVALPVIVGIGVACAATLGEARVALPVAWVFGYFLTLRPLAMASAALAQEMGAVARAA